MPLRGFLILQGRIRLVCPWHGRFPGRLSCARSYLPGLQVCVQVDVFLMGDALLDVMVIGALGLEAADLMLAISIFHIFFCPFPPSEQNVPSLVDAVATTAAVDVRHIDKPEGVTKGQNAEPQERLWGSLMKGSPSSICSFGLRSGSLGQSILRPMGKILGSCRPPIRGLGTTRLRRLSRAITITLLNYYVATVKK